VAGVGLGEGVEVAVGMGVDEGDGVCVGAAVAVGEGARVGGGGEVGVGAAGAHEQAANPNARIVKTFAGFSCIPVFGLKMTHRRDAECAKPLRISLRTPRLCGEKRE